MEATDYAAALEIEGARLTAIASDIEDSPDDSERPVAACPDWNLAKLLRHCATVWSFVTGSIEVGEPMDRSAISRGDRTLSRWHDDAVDGLLARLRACRPDEQVWTFDPDDQSVGFWWRRMAQEAAMHRWDAQHALGAVPDAIDAELAVDGINELFDFFIPRRNPTAWSGDGETLHLHATDADGEWAITRTPDGINLERAHRHCDAAARASAQDLLLFAWGRIRPDRLETHGDAALLSSWQEHVRF